jgi:hypothetical protein
MDSLNLSSLHADALNAPVLLAKDCFALHKDTALYAI